MASPHKKYYDLAVPLTSASSAGSTSKSWTRQQLAQIYQTRLRQLGYSGVAFCHTSYGRLDINKDDADIVLPWKDIISGANEEKNNYTFGRENSHGMSIYRRINIVLEEVTDVSRLLLPSQSNNQSISSMLRKYDIVSLQPMSESTFQNVCELLPSFDTNSDSTIPVDIIVLEYATGSRGGYGLPYRIRKDNIIKTMEAGVTFELCYATAMVDQKRRQGFLRTLTDFLSIYNSIQKKYMLINKHMNVKIGKKMCKCDRYPLLIGSGSRNNYSAGTDEGMITLRSPNDVQFLVGQSTFQDSWVEESKFIESHGKEKQEYTYLSAAEKVLARAKYRCLGVSTRECSVSEKKRKLLHHHAIVRAYVSGISSVKPRKKTNEDEASDNDSVEDTEKSVVAWLSAPIQRIMSKNTLEADDEDNESVTQMHDLSNNPTEQNEDDEDNSDDGYLAL